MTIHPTPAVNSAPHSLKGESRMVDFNHVVNNWYTTAQAAELTGLTQRTIANYCNSGRFNAIQIPPGVGQWYIDPASVNGFQKTRRGRKPSE